MEQRKEIGIFHYIWILIGELVEVAEASDWILVRLADELPPPRLQDAANIGQDRLLATICQNQVQTRELRFARSEL